MPKILRPAPEGAGTAGAVGPPRSETLGTRVHDILHRNATLGPLFVLLLAVLYFSFTADRFLEPANLSLVVQQVMVRAVAALSGLRSSSSPPASTCRSARSWCCPRS